MQQKLSQPYLQLRRAAPIDFYKYKHRCAISLSLVLCDTDTGVAKGAQRGHAPSKK